MSVGWVRGIIRDDSITRIEATRVGEGYGLESVIARVTAQGADRTHSLAVKFCHAEAALGEDHTYTTILAPTAVRRPNLIAAGSGGDHGVVVTDYVDGIQGDVLTGCSITTSLDIATSIADLHATWWGREAPGVPLLEEALRRPLTPAQVERCLADHHDVLDADTRAVFRTLPGRVDELADRLGRWPLTVVHGDLHLDNVLIGDDGGATIVDWGRTRRSPAAVDLARCFVEVLDARPDDPVGRGFLDHYADRLRASGVDETSARLREAIDLSLAAFAPGVIRRAAARRVDPGTRPWALLQNALARVGLLIG